MSDLKKTLESRMKIRFHDCDPFNHLNNSRYIDYIITARGDQLIENYNFDIYKLARNEGIGWVFAQTHISYVSPAFLMEEVVIQTQMIAFTDKTLLVEALMLNHDKSILKAALWTRLAHFNLKTQRSLSHSDDLMQFFQLIVNPPVADIKFEERIKSLKYKVHKN